MKTRIQMMLCGLSIALFATPALAGGMYCPPGKMMMHGCGGKVAPLLFTLALGYGVLVLARREGKPLNKIGKFVGWLILVVSFVGLLCIAASCMRCGRDGMMSAKGRCMMPPPEVTSPEQQPAPVDRP